VTVRENWGNGFVTQVDVVDLADQLHPIWVGIDPSAPGAVVDFRIDFERTDFLVKGVRIYVDTNLDPGWEEIDAIQTHGVRPDLSQWGDGIIDFSSQWSSGDYSAAQVLGEPNVFAYGDSRQAWSPLNRNGTIEHVTVEYAVPVLATGVTVRENWSNGFVSQVDVVDLDDQLHTVWMGIDPSQPGSVVDFHVEWAKTDFPAKGVRVYVDTDRDSGWEEIDAIRLHGAEIPTGDCNNNGIFDFCDIAAGRSLDDNNNGIPDECEEGPPLLGGYAVIHGEYVSGDLASLLASDDDRLHVNQRLATSLTLPVAGIEIFGETATAAPSRITVLVETSASSLPNLPPQVVSLYNHDADAWEILDERLATLTDAALEITIDDDAQRFVGPATAEIRMRVTWFDPGDVISTSWITRTDQAIWHVAP
jgi:hypothetical protein